MSGELEDALRNLKIKSSLLFYRHQITSFSNSIIDDIVSKCEFLFSVNDIVEKVPVPSVQHAFKVYDCLCRVFTDVQRQIRDERGCMGNFL